MNNKELAGLLREAACRADIEMNGVDGAYVVSRISTVIETLEKAAEGVEELETKLTAAEADAARYLKALTAIDEQLSETEGCGEIDVLMGMIAREAIDAATQKEES